MEQDKISMITVLTEKEFQTFKETKKIESSFIDTILHSDLVSALKNYMQDFGEMIHPISGLSILDNNFIRLQNLNTDLCSCIFDYLSVGTRDILIELEVDIHNIIFIEISKLFEINRIIQRTGHCSSVLQGIFKDNLTTDFGFIQGDMYSFLPDIAFAECKGCIKIGDYWENNHILDLENKKIDVSLLNIF